jgi:hypothetical protein
MTLKPNQPEYLYQRAMIQMQQNEYEKALLTIDQ